MRNTTYRPAAQLARTLDCIARLAESALCNISDISAEGRAARPVLNKICRLASNARTRRRPKIDSASERRADQAAEQEGGQPCR